MATNSTKPLNIKYGAKTALPKTTLADGTLYVATKSDNRAELHVGLDGKNYVISESIPVDNQLKVDSNNAISNSAVFAEFAEIENQIQDVSTLLEKIPEEYLSIDGGDLKGSLTVAGNISATGHTISATTMSADTFNGNATSATIAGNVSGVVEVQNGGTGVTSVGGIKSLLGIDTLDTIAKDNQEWIADNEQTLLTTYANNFTTINNKIGTSTINGSITENIAKLNSQIGTEDGEGTILERIASLEEADEDFSDLLGTSNDTANKNGTTAFSRIAYSVSEVDKITNRLSGLGSNTGDVKKYIDAEDKKIEDLLGVISAAADKNGTTAFSKINYNTSAITDLSDKLGDFGDEIVKDYVDDTFTTKTDFDKKVTVLNDTTTRLNTHVAIETNADGSVKTAAAAKATGSVFGHVKLSDSIESSSLGTSNATAATPKAVYDALSTARGYSQNVSDALDAHINHVDYHLFIGSAVDTSGNVPINADTLNGKTATQIIAEASGQTAEAGTVGFSTSVITSGTDVTLTNVSTGDALMPRTTAANVSGLDLAINNKLTSYIRFIVSNTEPTSAADKKLGVIWFHGTGTGKHIIKIWNGAT